MSNAASGFWIVIAVAAVYGLVIWGAYLFSQFFDGR